MPAIRRASWIAVTLTAPIVLAVGYYFFILDWDARPLCHKQLLLAFESWLDLKDSKVFPNVGGRSADSLAESGLGDDERWQQMYKYVPGLRKDDPGDLVLAYFAVPTRWAWHGPPPTVFAAKEWLVIPVDFAMSPLREIPPPWCECAERLSLAEFQSRLKRTLDFLRNNNRPDWESVVAEHTKFLESVPQEKH